ncbi:hypothetical protein RvY_16025-1 [Ramazzottius varieornatus]|uniref:Uncharacterized protein n=1 Tax=Ramazzottius varieornatus TaxID=947166 RepID=A0A1D1VX03_RAMVA|nr:hypothetical protein RvY_16025-1 [Ramazzottius varieornatus]
MLERSLFGPRFLPQSSCMREKLRIRVLKEEKLPREEWRCTYLCFTLVTKPCIRLRNQRDPRQLSSKLQNSAGPSSSCFGLVHDEKRTVSDLHSGADRCTQRGDPFQTRTQPASTEDQGSSLDGPLFTRTSRVHRRLLRLHRRSSSQRSFSLSFICRLEQPWVFRKLCR